MPVLLVLVLLVSGFIYCHENPRYYYKLHAYEGQYLYLQAGKLGLQALTYSIIFHAISLTFLSSHFSICTYTFYLDFNYINSLGNLLVDYNLAQASNAPTRAWIAILSISTLITPYLSKYVYISYLKWKLKLDSTDQVRIFLMSKIFADSPLDNFLLNSILSEDSVMICLDDRKVYVGKIASMGEPNENEGADQEINMLPLMSGYREKDDLRIIFNSSYKDVGDDLSVIIKQEKIISARKFDFSVWDQFRRNNKQPKLKSAKPRKIN